MKNKAARRTRIIWLFILVLTGSLMFGARQAGAWSLQLADFPTQVHDGTVGRSYYAPIYLANGTAPYEFSISSGSLPPGLYLYANETYAEIKGTPSAAGTYSFSVKVKDAASPTIQQSFSFTVRIAEKYTIFNINVGKGKALNVYGVEGNSFQAGEWVSLSYTGYVPKKQCFKRWIKAASVDLDQYGGFYMPAENLYVEAEYMDIVQGIKTDADLSPYHPGGPYGFDEYEENTLDAAVLAGLINRRVEYGSQEFAWYKESTENRYYDLDKDGTDDLQLIRVEQSTGGIVRFGGAVASNSLKKDNWVLSLPDTILEMNDKPIYETLAYYIGHHLKAVGFSYPTCETSGVKEHFRCSDCGALFWDAKAQMPATEADVTLDPSGHSNVLISGKKPTCTKEGLAEHFECSECGKCFAPNDSAGLHPEDPAAFVLPANGHAMTHITGSNPTCIKEGVVEHYECGECGEWFWDNAGKQLITDHTAIILNASGHTMNAHEAVPATCTKEGSKAYFDCANCKDWFWDEAGTKLIADPKEVLIPAAGHSFITISGLPATCETGGIIEHYECSECGEWFWDTAGTSPVANHEDTLLPALGHSWGEWTTVKQAGPGEAGLAERICSHDASHKETMEIPALPIPPTEPTAEMTTVNPEGTTATPAEPTEIPATPAATEPPETFPAESSAAPQETTPAAIPPETTKAAAQPPDVISPTVPSSSSPDGKGNQASSNPLIWVLIPVVLLLGISIGLVIALLSRNKALSAAAGGALQNKAEGSKKDEIGKKEE